MKYLLANWKMYLTVDESVALAEAVRGLAPTTQTSIAVFPSSLAFTLVRNVLQGSQVSLGAQNCSWAPRGAYTGAISAELLADAGASYVLIGHSERRHIFGEGDTAVHKKFVAALDAGLVPVLCIGETLEEKENDKREYRLKKQLFTALSDTDLANKKFMVAYEPVWAIASSGTGEACLPADVDDVHGWIRQELRSYTDAHIPLIYGGSVTAENVVSYVSYDTVDGVLVASASTHVDSFAALASALSTVA